MLALCKLITASRQSGTDGEVLPCWAMPRFGLPTWQGKMKGAESPPTGPSSRTSLVGWEITVGLLAQVLLDLNGSHFPLLPFLSPYVA